MNIIILGANQIGCTLAETLTSEANDITVVDSDANKLRELKDLLVHEACWHQSRRQLYRLPHWLKFQQVCSRFDLRPI